MTTEIKIPENENERHTTLLVLSLRWLNQRKIAMLAKDLLERVPKELRISVCEELMLSDKK